MKWMLLTSLFPNEVNPDNGIFNFSRMKALQNAGEEVQVIAPIDLTPHMRYILRNLSMSSIRKNWLDKYHIRKETVTSGLKVLHPRWYSPPRKMFWEREYMWLHYFCSNQVDRCIRMNKPDAVICSWLSPFGVYAGYIKGRYGLPVFVIPEGDDILLYPDMYKGWESLRKILNTNADRIICSSSYMKKIAEEVRKLNNVVHISNGYDNSLFRYEDHQQDPSRIRLLSVGYLDYIKGQDILIKALSKLDSRYELTLVGNGAMRTELEALVKKLGLQKRVHFAGFQKPEKLASYYRAADIYCLASRSEGFGISILEAMACGLPVVGSNAGGIPEKITPGVNGFIARSEDVSDFVEKINHAADIQWDRSMIATNIQEKYGWNQWASSMIHELNGIL